MMASEAVVRMQRKLGYRTDKADEMLQELQDEQSRLEIGGIPSPIGKGTFLPWFLITEQAMLTTVVNEERIPIPTDFAMNGAEDFKLYWFNEDTDSDGVEWNELTKVDESTLRRTTFSNDNPCGYYFSGNYWRLGPTPQSEFTLKMIYYAKDAVLTTTPDVTNKWLTYAPWLLISAAGMSMAQSLRDATALQSFQQQFAFEQQGMWSATESRFQASFRPVMGGLN